MINYVRYVTILCINYN